MWLYLGETQTLIITHDMWLYLGETQTLIITLDIL